MRFPSSVQSTTSFFPSAIRSFNNLDPLVKDSPSISSFKSKLQSQDECTPAYFSGGNRKAQIHHARIRMNCSLLNYDMYKCKLVNSPLCKCGVASETALHYFLKCDLYSIVRSELFDVLSTFVQTEITVQLLLFGDERQNYSFNKSLFNHVETFILKSKRF